MAELDTLTVPPEDAWANTAEMRERLHRAVASADAGRSYRLGEPFLLKLMAAADRAGGNLSREALDRLLAEAVASGEIAKAEQSGGAPQPSE